MRRATRLVLSGDPCQLPPTVKSQGARVLSTTLMERLVERHPDQTHLLQVQHRMHEAIMAFGNMKFYDGQLKAHPDVAARTLEGLKPWVVVTRQVVGLTRCVPKRAAACPIPTKRPSCWTVPWNG